ncbi:hypothetical protein TIFTF001_034650 [Ficus carica]|uniref:Uncharacterized protein n=1 Tax=Ficus carica TaxID=3494 RepID=A0AA88JAU0_FICCA|nr:hypothetical protein TIFTF001_034650 [Ficus carica]
MGVTGKGATVPVRAGDRRVVVPDADRYRSKAGFTTRIQVLRAPHRPSTCLFRRARGRWSAKGPILGERPALNTAEYIQRQYLVVGEYVDINTILPRLKKLELGEFNLKRIIKQ